MLVDGRTADIRNCACSCVFHTKFRNEVNQEEY